MNSLQSGGDHAALQPAHAPNPQAPDLTPAANPPAPDQSDLDSDAADRAAAAVDRALAPDPEPLPAALRAKLMECAERWLAQSHGGPDAESPDAHLSDSSELAQFRK